MNTPLIVSANGFHVTRAVVTLPRIGVWHAELDVGTDDPAKVGSAVTLSIGEGALSLQGTARRSGLYGAHSYVRVVGGAGGFGKAIDARFYRQTPARIPLSDALGHGGESLSASSDASKVDQQLGFWTRPSGTVGDALQQLATELDAAWRVLPDGSTWLGTETWPETKAKNTRIISESPEAGSIELHSDTPTLLPGTTYNGKRISRVEHTIEPSNVTTIAWFESDVAPSFGDVLRANLERFVRRVTQRIDYQAFYPCRVVSQNGDGTLELKPDLDRKLPGLSKVPIRYGIPGVTVKVNSGARVHVSYANGDPAKPFAAIWESEALKEVNVTASVMAHVTAPVIKLNEGTRPLARVGDSVVVATMPPGSPSTGVIVTGSANAFN
jgi:hypothetical protein